VALQWHRVGDGGRDRGTAMAPVWHCFDAANADAGRTRLRQCHRWQETCPIPETDAAWATRWPPEYIGYARREPKHEQNQPRPALGRL